MTVKDTTTVRRCIRINGKEYASIDEIPQDVQDKNKVLMEMLRMDDDSDGVPDLLQAGPGYTMTESEVPEAVITTTRTIRITDD